MPQVFKESEYRQNQKSEPDFSQIFDWESQLNNGLAGLRSDFSEVTEAAKKFPVRSMLTIIGLVTVLYIGFKFTRSFVKIANRLRG